MDELKKNEYYTVQIEGYTAEAMGVCRIHERVVFVPNALVGETWIIKILKVTDKLAYARGETLLHAVEARVPPACPYFGKCGGCDTMHMDYAEELRFKLDRVNQALRHIGKQDVQAEVIIACEKTSHYRNKGIFAVANVDGQAACGFFRERSHALIPIQSCEIQTELSFRCAQAVVAFLRENRLPAYDEETGRGTVRHVFCRQAVHGRDAVVCIVSAGGFGDKTQALVDYIRSKCPELTGIVLNINKKRGNTVLAGDFYTLWGNPIIRDSLNGLEFEISPQAFFQINPLQTEKLYNRAVEYAVEKPAGLILDLYCGAGTISLHMAKHAKAVIGAEIVAEAIENAARNAAQNKIDNVEFLCADAGAAALELARRGLKPDVIVVDPPRKGLSETVIEAVASMKPERVVYVSCNPATLARDILRFQDHQYSLKKAEAYDMFPRTCHVETVCCLYHQKKDFISVPYEP